MTTDYLPTKNDKKTFMIRKFWSKFIECERKYVAGLSFWHFLAGIWKITYILILGLWDKAFTDEQLKIKKCSTRNLDF